MKTTKTTLTEKIGYSVASLGDSSYYGFISVFLLFFLTTIAGISPAVAGTISAIGALWNAIFNPIMGYVADRVFTRFGRRRPVIFAFALPMVITSFLLFTNINLPDGIKPIYYGIMLMIYWSCYTGFFVPYLALGAEYTSDYDDRTVLRLFSSFFNMIGTLFSMVIPNLIVSFFQNQGMTPSQSWAMTGLVLGLVAATSVLLTVATSKKKDPPCKKPEDFEKIPLQKAIVDIFREYISVAKLQPMRYLIVANLCGLIIFTMLMSNVNYYFIYVKGLSSVEASSWLLLRCFIGIGLIPLSAKLLLKFDKRETLIGYYIIGAIGLIILRFVSLPLAMELGLYMLFLSVCTSVYWQIMPGIFYDMCEYDRVKNGKMRTATIVSFQGLVEALAAGIGGQLLGLILDAGGFDGAAAVQSETAITWIANSATLIPVGFVVVSCIALYKYPINKKVYEELLAEASQRETESI